MTEPDLLEVELTDEEEDEFWDEWDRTHLFFAIKWICEGLSDPADVAATFEGHALMMRQLVDAGWRLEQPVDNGYMSFGAPEGEDYDTAYAALGWEKSDKPT